MSRRWAPIDPGWSFRRVVEVASEQFKPGSSASGSARNAMLRDWVVLVGGKIARDQIGVFVLEEGGVVSAARAIRMSPETLRELKGLAESLPDEVVIRPGLSTWFGVVLAPIDRIVLEAFVHQFGLDAKCGIVEVRQDAGVTMVRFDGGTTEDLRRIGDLLWSRAIAISGDVAICHSSEGGTQQAVFHRKLDAVIASLARLELRSQSDDVREMLEDQGAAYVLQKDKNLVATWGQKTVRAVFEETKKRLLGSLADPLDPMPIFKRILGTKDDES